MQLDFDDTEQVVFLVFVTVADYSLTCFFPINCCSFSLPLTLIVPFGFFAFAFCSSNSNVGSLRDYFGITLGNC